ncbi:MAG: SAM-dependent methyltransferase [Firmicutes bacterium]|nr:SAM-dependent methyltransferase [Bacillota bacterium]
MPHKIVFGGKRRKSLECTRVTMRPLMLGGKLLFQAEYTYPKKVTHTNLEAADAVKLALTLVAEDFKQVNIFTESEEIQVLASKPENPRITKKKTGAVSGAGESRTPSCSAQLSHNRTKNYIIPDGIPCDFLIELGVMGDDGKVFPRAYSKYRQINRYLEIVDDVFEYLPQDHTLRIIDFGCGKAYLTFALYHYLKIIKDRDVEIIGLDLKEDVIRFCSDVARRLGYNELKFLMGDIADYSNDRADMVVTLHACDTATDYALINAVKWGTEVILSVPCCQHELFSQIKNDLHQPILKYGILKDRLTEYLTDGLRGLKLESCGYDVTMIEFTGLEHTARNIMIKAIKTEPNAADKRTAQANARAAAAKARRAQEQYRALCEFYNVTPTIDKLK